MCPSCRGDAHNLCSDLSVLGDDVLCCDGLVIDRRPVIDDERLIGP